MKNLIIKTTVALIILGSSIQSSLANSAEKCHNFNLSAADTYYLLAEENEKPVLVEDWMKNPSHFENYLLRELKEQDIDVKRWMYNTDYFYSLHNYSDNKNPISIESWMVDPGYFYPVVPTTSKEKALLIEDWMMDVNYFLPGTFADKNKPEKTEKT